MVVFSIMFQSTHPLGVRLTRLKILRQQRLFQSTHPLGVRQQGRAIDDIETVFQSTHPLGVRLFGIDFYDYGNRVSIHAPTRGATRLRHRHCLPCCGFNPRTHSGCDVAFQRLHIIARSVSIHAPTRGATLMIRRCLKLGEFQSTHPLGVRQGSRVLYPSLRRFNPRTHSGCDIVTQVARLQYYVSIHAPTRGATHLFSCRVILMQVSIHAPTRGATYYRIRCF